MKKTLIIVGAIVAILTTGILIVFARGNSREVGESLGMNEEKQVISNNAHQEVEEWKTLYPFEEDGLWGYKDAAGSVIIEPQFRIAARFSEGLAWVIDSAEQRGYIDLTGQFVFTIPEGRYPGEFSDGFAHIIVRDWDRGNEEINIVSHNPGPFIFIDRTGKNAFDMEFAHAERFIDGLAIVILLNGRSAFINTKGENAFDMEFRVVSRFIDGFARVRLLNGNEAFISRTDGNAFNMEFRSVGEFDERGYARVELLDGTTTFIDREGNLQLHRTWQ